MMDHTGFAPTDLARSRRFYDAALAPLGMAARMEVTPAQSGGYHGIGYGSTQKPVFWLSGDRRLAAPVGAGQARLHLAFQAPSRAAVDAFHAAALAHGGSDNGPPGIRAHYHPAYYAAFVLDPDGVNVEAVCHQPE